MSEESPLRSGPVAGPRSTETPWLVPFGENAAEFREGWLSGKASVTTKAKCPYPAGSIGRAAFYASKAFQRELRPC